jgi:hypothetical protein
MEIDKSIVFKIGIGGIIDGELMTFDFKDGEKLRPYVCHIIGRDFKYQFQREFAEKKYDSFSIKLQNRSLGCVKFKIDPFKVYEYKRFCGNSIGEIEEGYFVVVDNRVIELDYEEVRHWCGTPKEKMRTKIAPREIFGPKDKKYAPEDIDF